MSLSQVIGFSDRAIKIKTAYDNVFWVPLKIIDGTEYSDSEKATKITVPEWFKITAKITEQMLLVEGEWHLDSFPQQTNLTF